MFIGTIACYEPLWIATTRYQALAKRYLRTGKKQPKDKVFGQDILGTSGDPDVGISVTPGPGDVPDKSFMQGALFWLFQTGKSGMSRDLGRDVPGSEKLYARKLWADFSFPTINCHYRELLREGVNREKANREKAHINNEMFFHRLRPLQTVKKLCVNREKIGTQKSHHFFTVSFSPFSVLMSCSSITGTQKLFQNSLVFDHAHT